METIDLAQELSGNTYPGRGIVIGRSADGKNEIGRASCRERV